jgi:hypothetical protein
MTAPMRYSAPTQIKPNCSVVACDRVSRTRGLCSFHYLRQWQGKPIEDELRATAPRGVRTARDAEGRKQCADCQEWLPESAYASQPKSGDGLRARCRSCTRIRRMAEVYGLSREQYDALFESQGRRCAICGVTQAKWVIDHDHACCEGERRKQVKTCGRCVRGILCDPCNTGLGRFGDSAAVLLRAAAYLGR